MTNEKSMAILRAKRALFARLTEAGINMSLDPTSLHDPNLLAILQATHALEGAGVELGVDSSAHAGKFLEKYGGRLALLLDKAGLPVNQTAVLNYVNPYTGRVLIEEMLTEGERLELLTIVNRLHGLCEALGWHVAQEVFETLEKQRELQHVG